MRPRFLAYALSAALLVPAVVPGPAFATKDIQGSPKIINLFLNWQLREEDLPGLARWDAVVLDADQQARYPDRVRKLRQLNPAIKLLAYLPSEEIATARFSEPSDYPFAKLAGRIQDAWYLRDPSGNPAYFWPGSQLLNVTDRGPAGPTGERWNEFFPRFIKDEILSSGMWDGVFLDNTFDGISYFAKSAVDLDRDGRAESSANADAAWRDGMTKMLRRIRSLNPSAIVVGNGGAAYAAEMNGTFFEHFPSWSWGPNWKDFRDAVAKSRSPQLTALNVNTDNQDRPADYRLMRFGLASALAGGGWYSFDKGDWGHDVIWWYDEYEATIGTARSAPRILGAARGSGVVPAVWGRDFEKGLAVVNSTDAAQKVTLPGVFEKLRGRQDPGVNNGTLITTLELAAKDGILLLRRSEAADIRGSAYQNGAFVRVYDAQGKQKQNGFFAQRTDAASGATLVGADLDRDGSDDLVIADRGLVTIRFGSGRAAVAFRPFGAAYKGALFVSAGNTDRDNALEIVIGKEGAPPQVRTFNMRGAELRRWSVYNPSFGGGVRTAIGDLNGDGLREIVTAAGPGGGPHIRIWKTDGTIWGGGFFAFDPTAAGGVSVAVGDIDGDGKDEVVAGSGLGAIPKVRVFDGRGILKSEFTLGSKPLPGGLQVAASDTDGDGRADIVVAGLPAI